MEEQRPERAGGAARRILNALAEGERSVNEIVRITGLSQPNVSNHLSRLRRRNWVTARRHGHQVHYALAQPDLPREQRAEGGERSGPGGTHSPAALPAPVVPAMAADFLAALLRLDEARAGAVVAEALARGLNWKEIGRRLMEPALVRVGELWAEGELSVAEEHAATAITTRLHERLAAGIQPPEHPIGRAVVAGVAGNQHGLGIRMVADYVTAAGWETHFLGSDLPEADLMSMVRRLQPDAVLLSVSLEDQLPALRSAAAKLREWRQSAGTPFPLVVGGGRGIAGETPATALTPGEGSPDLQGSDPDALIEELGSRLALVRSRPG